MRVVSAFVGLECTHCRNQDPLGKQEHRYLVEVAVAKCGESIRLCVGCARRAASLAVAWTGEGSEGDATGQPVANVKTDNGEKPPIQELIQRVHMRREQLLQELALQTAWLVAIGRANEGRIVVPRLVVQP